MQAVELICICCLCCAKVVQCSCKDQRTRRFSRPFFFFFSLASIGLLIWGSDITSQYKDENQAYNPGQQSCEVMCGEYYEQQGQTGNCCWESDCRSKQQCQEDWDDFFDSLQLSCYILMGCAAAYIIFCIGYYIVKCAKGRIRRPFFNNEADGLIPIEALLEDDGPVNDSGVEERLRDSMIVRDSNLCSICLDAYDHQKAIRLECGHMFHSECIRIWVSNRHDTCPLCRGNI